MNTFEKYINKTENQDLKNFTKYLDAHELAMLEMHFLSFAKEQLRIHDVVVRSERLVCDKCGYPMFYHKPDDIMYCHGCDNTKPAS